jgi:hypothetical protein
MPVELALDFAALAMYDIVLYADDSGSMAFEVRRRQQAQKIFLLPPLGTLDGTCVQRGVRKVCLKGCLGLHGGGAFVGSWQCFAPAFSSRQTSAYLRG